MDREQELQQLRSEKTQIHTQTSRIYVTSFSNYYDLQCAKSRVLTRQHLNYTDIQQYIIYIAFCFCATNDAVLHHATVSYIGSQCGLKYTHTCSACIHTHSHMQSQHSARRVTQQQHYVNVVSTHPFTLYIQSVSLCSLYHSRNALKLLHIHHACLMTESMHFFQNNQEIIAKLLQFESYSESRVSVNSCL